MTKKMTRHQSLHLAAIRRIPGARVIERTVLENGDLSVVWEARGHKITEVVAPVRRDA